MKRTNTGRETASEVGLTRLFPILRYSFRVGRLCKGPKLTFPGMRLGRRPIFSGALSCLALLVMLFQLTISTSHAAFIEVERGIDGPGSVPSCRVVLEGKIKQGDFDGFVEAIERGWTLGCQQFVVVLSSLGGDLVEGIKIGRLVRELAAYTYAPFANIPGHSSCALFRYKRRGGCICGSACSLIWAAGVYRQGDQVYVHRPHFKQQLEDPFSKTSLDAYRSGFVLARNYLREMHVPEIVIEKTLATPSVEGSRLGRRELQMMEVDPIYEELVLRECGAKNKKNIYTQNRAELRKTLAYNECKSEFHAKHSPRLRSNAQAYINKLRGTAPPPRKQDISGTWNYIARCQISKSGKRFKSSGHLELAMNSGGHFTGNIRVPSEPGGAIRNGRLDGLYLQFENAYKTRKGRETIEVWKGNLGSDGKGVSGRISASGSISYGCDFEATR